jgi:hypothetical protein
MATLIGKVPGIPVAFLLERVSKTSPERDPEAGKIEEGAVGRE